MKHSSPILLCIGLLCAFASGMLASGAYWPVHVTPQDESIYNLGKALFAGDIRVGSGPSCASCHMGAQTLKRDSLRRLGDELDEYVARCVARKDRANGKLDKKQMEGLLTFIRKRNRV
jgi:hypothetical protein